MAQFDYQRRDSAEELLAGWMGELESVLYCAEVEEAIKEVCQCWWVWPRNAISPLGDDHRSTQATTHWTRKTSTL